MSPDWLVALEATALAGALRGSVWAYPLVNAAHILGVALLVRGILPLDLRLLGAWRVLTRMAGAGLGLAIVRNLVNVLSGEIAVANRAGGGAMFTVLLPLLEEPSEHRPPELQARL